MVEHLLFDGQFLDVDGGHSDCGGRHRQVLLASLG